MFLSYRSLSALSLILLGLIFGFGWYLTKAPSEGELAEGRKEALGYLLRSFDEDIHFVTRYGLDSSPPPVTREEQFIAELEAATTLADASRGDTTLAGAHRENLHIILTDWYVEAGNDAYLTNGTPFMEQNGRGLALLATSPLFEEERAKAEKLATPIASWARKEFTTYWKAASSTAAESLGYGILGISALYLRTGSPEHRETLELLAARYRLLLDPSPLRFAVRSTLYESLRGDEDRRSLLLIANSYLPLQDKNFFSASYGLFRDTDGTYYPLAEQAMITRGLVQASVLVAESNDSASHSYKQAALRSAGALLRMQMDAPEQLKGGALGSIKRTYVDTYATAQLIEALDSFK
ncbi:hypothetical protein K8Q93_03815 [Candidatus Parcubacteria bacterium]|nr:hypothetical protein [Candidatus Parcubacteria bacterium]